MKPCLCIFGFGYTASYLADICHREGVTVIGVSRNPSQRSDNTRLSYVPVHFSAQSLFDLPICPTHILISTPPQDMGDPTLREFERYITSISSSLASIGYLSTTGVYGDHEGAWVNELSDYRHPGPKARQRLAAEKAWKDFANNIQVPLYIFRIASIYGPDRNPLQKIKHGKSVSIFKKDHFFSRIHVKDLAKTIKTGLFQPQHAGIYNVCDNEPTLTTTVDDFSAKLLGVNPLPHQAFDQATVSAMMLEFYIANKRVSNAKMRTILGVELDYPTFREGLTALFEQNHY